MRNGQGPLVELTVEAGDWPGEAALRQFVDVAVGAALATLAEEDGVGRSSLNGSNELSILFTDDEAVRHLNARWRGKDRPTNVLSFPQADDGLLGDIVLAYETVQAEAALAGKRFEDHMAHLIIHGLLHLLGHDHEKEEDADNMEGLERRALARIGIADPYAAARE